MIELLQNKIKVALQYLCIVLLKFLVGTIKGIKFFFIQIFAWVVIETFFSLLGYNCHWRMLALSLQICILSYTMLYSWFYSFAPVKLKNIFVLYIIYASSVYLEIVQNHNWNFKIVTIDEYMLLGWFAPLYGLVILISKAKIKRWLLPKYSKIYRVVKITFYIFISIIMLLVVWKLFK